LNLNRITHQGCLSSKNSKLPEGDVAPREYRQLRSQSVAGADAAVSFSKRGKVSERRQKRLER
jgi:hypothetical protein